MSTGAEARNEGGAPIRLLLLDDHEVVRVGLVSLLEAEGDLTVVATARTAEEALPLYRQHRPDVTLVDLRLPGMGGADFIKTVREEAPAARFVVLTTFDFDEDIFRAFRAGAQAYVLKDGFRQEIIEAIRAVHAGKTIVPEDVARRLEARASAEGSVLSPREVEVLTLVARGEINKIIAARLGITEGTVKTHLVRIFEKLGAADRTSAVTAALARGVIRL
jgi:two-component system NarL family response regulator